MGTPKQQGFKQQQQQQQQQSRRKTTLNLRLKTNIPGNPLALSSQLRKSVSSTQISNDLFHQHVNNKTLKYRYPMIQYHWVKDSGLIVGWGEEAFEALLNLSVNSVFIGGKEVEVVGQVVETSEVAFGISDETFYYYTQTPVMLYKNSENYQAFIKMSMQDQVRDINRKLVAAILTSFRGLGVQVPSQLKAEFKSATPVWSKFKETGMITHQGVFVSNAIIPEDFGIGGTVSHGYGRISKE